MSGHAITRRHLLLGAGALAAGAVHAESPGASVVLKAGDQKGGLRALLEAADELKGIRYEIR